MTWAIWITGVPGSGTSVLARAAAETLPARGVPVKVLELDALRTILTPTPTHSDHEREAVDRLLAFMAATLVEADVPVIVDATAHRRHWRQLARELIANFAEVQLESAEDVASAAAKIVALAERLGAASPPAAPRGDGWAIWITGRPGSGKTTIARRVMTALAARGVKVRIVEATSVRRILWPIAIENLEDLVHRAVVCLGRLLVDAGIAVIVDATAHHRRWRELARGLIPHFAEIQLACPPEVCAERERATRWGLTGSEGGRSAPAVSVDLDLLVDYEAALAPELTIYTDVQDSATAAADVLFVAERFHPRSSTRQGGSHASE